MTRLSPQEIYFAAEQGMDEGLRKKKVEEGGDGTAADHSIYTVHVYLLYKTEDSHTCTNMTR